MKKVSRKCPICNHDLAKILYNQKFELISGSILPNVYDIICCEQCNFIYVDSTAVQEDYNTYYKNLSKYEDSDISSGGITAIDNLRYNRMFTDLEPFINNESRILDIGCANGGLLNILSKKGYKNLVGLDPSENCVKEVSKLGLRAIQGDIFNNELLENGELFDVVILSHVLEHVCDLKGLIEKIDLYLSSNGLVYIEVPDANRYFDYYLVPFHYFDLEHINHFTEYSLSNLFLQSSYKLVKFGEKEIPASNQANYPAIFGIYQKITDKNPEFKYKVNDLELKSVLNYIEKSYENKSLLNKIEELCNSNKEIVIWGVGQYTLKILNDTNLSKCNINYFIDKSVKKQGQNINGVKICSPSTLIDRHFKGTIVVSSALYSEDIINEIKEMGLTNELIELR